MKQEFVIINGRAYSPITGLPVENADPATLAQPKKADKAVTSDAKHQRGATVKTIHKSHTQHATTLNRRHVKRPTARPLASRTKQTTQQTTAVKNSNVNRFAQKPITTVAQKPKPIVNHIDRPAQNHPVAQRAKSRQIDISQPRKQRLERAQIATSKTPLQPKNQTPIAKTALKPASVLKNEAISEALAREVVSQKPHRQKKSRSSFGKWISFASAGMAVMLLGGYFTYLSMPNISVRVAAVQSGIDAKYPGYSPNGYSLRGPIAFKDGEVTMKFAYVSSDLEYTVTQQKSSWDSSAVKDFVTENSGAPTITTVDGLTLYTSGSQTTWVNGGILYQIDGDAVLSGEQIRKIATSM